MTVTWREEFGADYAVPLCITAALDDQSWHNDIAPSFSHPLAPSEGDHDLRLWVEHPGPDMPRPRFFITDCVTGETFFQGEDALEAVAALADQAALIAAARAAV